MRAWERCGLAVVINFIAHPRLLTFELKWKKRSAFAKLAIRFNGRVLRAAFDVS